MKKIIESESYIQCYNAQIIEKEPFMLELTHCNNSKEEIVFDIKNEKLFSIENGNKVEKGDFGKNISYWLTLKAK